VLQQTKTFPFAHDKNIQRLELLLSSDALANREGGLRGEDLAGKKASVFVGGNEEEAGGGGGGGEGGGGGGGGRGGGKKGNQRVVKV